MFLIPIIFLMRRKEWRHNRDRNAKGHNRVHYHSMKYHVDHGQVADILPSYRMKDVAQPHPPA